MPDFKQGDVIVNTKFQKMGTKYLVLDNTHPNRAFVMSQKGNCIGQITNSDFYDYEKIGEISIEPILKKLREIPVDRNLKDPYASLAGKLPWPLSDVPRYLSRVRRLRRQGWYRTMSGGYCDSHGSTPLSRQEIYHMSGKDFELYID